VLQLTPEQEAAAKETYEKLMIYLWNKVMAKVMIDGMEYHDAVEEVKKEISNEIPSMD